MEQKSIIERAMGGIEAPGPAGQVSAAPGDQAIPAGQSASGQSVAESNAPEVRSRTVELDFDKLRSNTGISLEGHFTRTTEEIRLIKRSVLLTRDKRRKDGSRTSNLILVTSTREGEGKTFIAMNLALSIAAERNTRALLIDGDLSRPSLLNALGVSAERGLIDVLTDDTLDLADVLLSTNVAGLTLLPAGQPHPLNTELLSSDRMHRLMSELSRRYDDRVIILDAPPVLATSESAALAVHVGQIIFVVEAGHTSQAAVREAINLISICPDISFVMNKVTFQFGATRFGTYYKNYRDSYYGEAKRMSRSQKKR